MTQEESSLDSANNGVEELVRQYEKLIETVELQAVNLISCHVELDNVGDDEPVDEFRLEPPGFRWKLFEENVALQCGVKFGVRATSGEEHGHLAVNVSAEYALVYTLPSIEDFPSEDVAEKFAERNAIFNAWPFFRELTHSLVSRIGFPRLVIPLYRLPVKLGVDGGDVIRQ